METLLIPDGLWQAMQADVQARAPTEACGLVPGVGNLAQAVIPVTNILQSPVRYRMDPQEQIDAFIAMETQGQELLAIYHSHPTGPNGPSATDIAEAYYPDSIYLIWFPGATGWDCQGFRIRAGAVHAVQVQRI